MKSNEILMTGFILMAIAGIQDILYRLSEEKHYRYIYFAFSILAIIYFVSFFVRRNKEENKDE